MVGEGLTEDSSVVGEGLTEDSSVAGEGLRKEVDWDNPCQAYASFCTTHSNFPAMYFIATGS